MIKKSFNIGLDHISVTAKKQLSSQRCHCIQSPYALPVTIAAGQKVLLIDGWQKA